MEYKHSSVMLYEVINGLEINPSGIYVDCTLGGGGHSFQIAQRLRGGRLIGIDQDTDALDAASERMQIFKDIFTPVHSNFKKIGEVLEDLEIPEVDGILIDLGVSSYQLDCAERGFSYMADGPLDMRMNAESSLNAKTVLNEYSQEELTRIISEYGEERWAHRIAQFIVNERPLETTSDLVDVIKKAVPLKARKSGSHPAKRTFQAIRIEVNNELGIIEQTILDSVGRLKKGGRLAIITFHSLEDRIVKRTYKHLESKCICPPDVYKCICDKKVEVKIITKKPQLPGDEELEYNPRARSAKLRILEKI